ncbi:sulfatase family protein [Capillimicrobium parvum]|uniref:Ulvan-active sulfatase n=1 Tax=Capillimicrobium parvum TaxID=2884022 RepID=A0A9E6XU44_9ACTN|nr:sulfatase [Capillimicrobium parvum]UGS34414.1 Ulvan-active sulfatase [Capillimicrobium parvum]
MALRPNVLYLHSHDTGRWIQPYGHPVQTPNLQHLADQGVLFRQAFCAVPTCSGSRAALLTGQYGHNNGMIGLAHRGFALNDPRQHIVHTLREAGYWSAMIGEQHIARDPAAIGYDRVYKVPTTHVASVAPIAIDVLSNRPPQPFFLSVGFFETHRDFFAPSAVRDALTSLPPANLPDAPETRRDMAGFKASARILDQGVGAVLQALDLHGLAESTLVVFTTDHGIAFPGAKATLYDRGLGVALILAGPGGFGGGRVIDALVSHLDLYPTLCDLAGVEHPPFVQGRSLLPLARRETGALHEAIFAEATFHTAYEPQRAVRTERFKYIRRFGDRDLPVLANTDDGPSKELLLRYGWADRHVDREQLYDLIFDPDEGDNLAADPAYADVRRELAARLERWMRETRDPLLDGPVPAPPGAEINLPDQVSSSEPTTRIAGPGTP